MSEFIFEILTEEIPARMQEKARIDLEQIVTTQLKQAHLPFDHVECFVTPRRLALCVQGLPLLQAAQTTERKGPRIDAPEAAQKGFFESLNLTPDLCFQHDTGKGIYWMAKIVQEGRPTLDVLKEIIPTTLSTLSFPKSMRWGDKKMTWVRPIRRLLCVFEGQKIDVPHLEVPVVTTTRGHRFMGESLIHISSWQDYKMQLLKNHVILDSKERRRIIMTQLTGLLEGSPYKILEDEGLCAEVTGLVEWPHVLKGKIDPQFMILPKELMIAVCRKHQRYFLAQDAHGQLAPFFLFAANITPKDGGITVIAGNERVLRARLSDGLFFFQTDQKKSLETHLEGLKKRIFHQKLGTMHEKVERLIQLSLKINALTYQLDAAQVTSAARLSKADLTTGLVNEFPELQGIAGKYYAQREGYDQVTAQAIEDHYKPQGPGDQCPSSPLSIIVALADKIDTLQGFFSIHEKPTGSKDPFALRRSGLGIIRLILENNLCLDLKVALNYALSLYTGAPQMDEVYAFILERLRVLLKDQGLPHDVISACLDHDKGLSGDLCERVKKIYALNHMLSRDQGPVLRMVFSRTANILKDMAITGDSAPILFEQVQERALHEAFLKISDLSDYVQAFEALLTLGEPLNAFFEHVTVNDENPALRENRIKLLTQIRDFALQFANFYVIEG